MEGFRRCEKLLAPLDVSVVSRSSAALGVLVASDDESAAAIAIDVAACLGASHFSAAPRSGLSTHLAALHACAHGAACAPNACTAYASTGCGGRFPATLLSSGAADARGRGPHSPYCKAVARAAAKTKASVQ